jgi:hypothetical protein
MENVIEKGSLDWKMAIIHEMNEATIAPIHVWFGKNLRKFVAEACPFSGECTIKKIDVFLCFTEYICVIFLLMLRSLHFRKKKFQL